MFSLSEQSKEKLARLCRRFHVRRLDLIGSATRDDFDATGSDLDFLVEFDASVGSKRFDTFFALQRALQQLFDRPVDLMEPGGLRNPYLIARIKETRKAVYDAKSAKVNRNTKGVYAGRSAMICSMRHETR